MTHNLDLGPEAGLLHALALLRDADLTLPVVPGAAPDVAVQPGIFLSLDPEGAVSGSLRSAPGGILALDLAVDRPGRWIALHFALGETDLSGRLVIGFACRTRAPAATPVRVALRSGTEGGFADRFFRKTVVAHAEPSVHVDAIEIAEAPDLPAGRTWRELVLFFRPESQTVDLQDLRLFIV
jgi:hypothetical protein